MYRNGVSHEVVQNDLDGIRQILIAMSYLSEKIQTDDPARMFE